MPRHPATAGTKPKGKKAFSSFLKFLEKILRLYEQGANLDRIGQYIKRWLQWCRAGLVSDGYDRSISYINVKELSEVVRN